MSPSSAKPAPPPTWMGLVITQLIAACGCVVIPVLVTWMAPVSTVRLEKSGAQNRAMITRYVLLFVPWKTEELANLSSVKAEITEERRHRTAEERRRGHTGILLATGQISLINESEKVVVQAAPDLAKTTSSQMTEFLASSTPETYEATLYASWPITYLVGGVLTGLCVFYLICVTLAVVIYPFKVIGRLMRLPAPEPTAYE